MRRKTRSLIWVTAAVAFAVVAAYAFLTAAPPLIPYEAWSVPEHATHPLAQTKDDPVPIPVSPEALLRSGDFTFTMGVGSGMFGLDIFRVDGTGQASYVFCTSPEKWWEVRFRVSPASLAQLRELLQEVDYLSLKRAYHANVADGTQWCIRVDVAGETKKVYCNNYFPEAAVRLARLVGQEILPAHDAEIRQAKRIREVDAERARARLW